MLSQLPVHEPAARPLLSLSSFPLSEHELFILSLVAGPVGCFQFVAVWNKAAVTILAPVFVWTVNVIQHRLFGAVSKGHHRTQSHLGPRP